MIPHVVEAGMPLLAICRGFQEMNVAFGGTLWQKLHEVAGLPQSQARISRRRSMSSTVRRTKSS